MSLHNSKMPTAKDKLAQEERDLLAELEAVKKEKKRAVKELPSDN